MSEEVLICCSVDGWKVAFFVDWKPCWIYFGSTPHPGIPVPKWRFRLRFPTKHVTILVVPVTGWGGRPKVLLKIRNDITKLEISSFIKVLSIDTCLNHSWNWNVVLWIILASNPKIMLKRFLCVFFGILHMDHVDCKLNFDQLSTDTSLQV